MSDVGTQSREVGEARRTAATHLIAEGKIHRPGYGVMRFGRDPAVGPSLFSDDNESKPVGDEKSLAREVAS